MEITYYKIPDGRILIIYEADGPTIAPHTLTITADELEQFTKFWESAGIPVVELVKKTDQQGWLDTVHTKDCGDCHHDCPNCPNLPHSVKKQAQ